MTKRDYYEILGLSKGGSAEEIKRAYRKLAMQHHPDRVGGEDKKEAEERFKEISEAYAVLSDPKKRGVYDQYGHAGFDQRFTTEDIFRGADFSSFEDLFGESILGDLLGGLFGTGFGTRGRRGSRGRDLELELTVSFEEAAAGVAREVTVPRRDVCTDCRGAGGERATCSTCQGAGQIRQAAGFMVIARACPRCGGQGSELKRACKACGGDGRVLVQRKIEVKVPAGIESGMRLRLTGEGEAGTRGRGDLYVHLLVRPHPIFSREGSTLLLDYPVNIAQAALGAEVEVPTLNGRVRMKVPSGTQSGVAFRVRGKGLPDVRDGRRGDLLVRVIVETPTKLNATQRRLLEQIAKTFGDEVHPSHRTFLKKLKGFFSR